MQVLKDIAGVHKGHFSRERGATATGEKGSLLSLPTNVISQLKRPLFNISYTTVSQLAKDLLHPTPEEEKRRHKKKRLVQSPNSYFMDVKCPGEQLFFFLFLLLVVGKGWEVSIGHLLQLLRNCRHDQSLVVILCEYVHFQYILFCLQPLLCDVVMHCFVSCRLILMAQSLFCPATLFRITSTFHSQKVRLY